jgi:hypothetical protein
MLEPSLGHATSVIDTPVLHALAIGAVLVDGRSVGTWSKRAPGANVTGTEGSAGVPSFRHMRGRASLRNAHAGLDRVALVGVPQYLPADVGRGVREDQED